MNSKYLAYAYGMELIDISGASGQEHVWIIVEVPYIHTGMFLVYALANYKINATNMLVIAYCM